MRPMAITMGDAAGIGPEIIAKAFRDAPLDTRGCFVAGDLATMRRATALVAGNGVSAEVVVLEDLQQIWQCPPDCIPVWPLAGTDPAEAPVAFGQLSARAGQMAGDCVVWATQAALRGEVAALVTAPLNKAALSLAGLPHAAFPGHTEMLQALVAQDRGQAIDQWPVRMMLANDELRVVLLSIHVSLRDALAAVTFENVLQSLQIAHHALQQLLGRAPRIGVAGLNPHAGETGLFGREEIDMGVNVTLGLPLVRTSPDHGTAFDIAGQGLADPASLVAAIRMARQLSGNLLP